MLLLKTQSRSVLLGRSHLESGYPAAHLRGIEPLRIPTIKTGPEYFLPSSKKQKRMLKVQVISSWLNSARMNYLSTKEFYE